MQILKKVKYHLQPKRIATRLRDPHRLLSAALWRLSLRVNRQKNKKFKADLNLLVSSGFFDPEFYLEKYPDVRGYGPGPVKHYYFHGCREGRHPHANFNAVFFTLLK